MKKILLLTFTAFLGLSATLPAQNQPQPDPKATDTKEEDGKKSGESPGPNRFWQASVNGGNYMVALDRIVSVSRQKYLLDGAVVVDEVTVDTVGQALARFYFLSPVTDEAPGNTVSGIANRGKELVEKAGQRAGANIQNMVVKKYPETTHAKELEYRVLTLAQLSSLYSSVNSAWESGRGRKFSAE